MFVRGTYFDLPGVTYDELYPVSLIIAKPNEDDSVRISLVSWTILSFNSIRISKGFWQ
jgi:hypothetical protein